MGWMDAWDNHNLLSCAMRSAWPIPEILFIPSIRFAKKTSNRPGTPDLDRSVEARFLDRSVDLHPERP
jgi:hypothetical protein